MQIKLLRFSDKDFEGNLKDCLEFDSSNNEQIMDVAKNILLEIKEKGDKALIGFTKQFDSLNIENALSLEITPKDINTAFNNISQDQKKALEEAASRIFEYHKKQKNESWSYEDVEGSLFGQKVTPLDRVGLYVPGGKAAYPSSVLMNAIPAKVAGVQELIMVVPTPNGERNDLVLAAAKVAQVDRIFSIGGAQAIGALAYGTETIPKVDKIVGPGNAYVAEAKRRVFGTVGIDMIAGPSEILIISDKNSNPDWIAMDLFSQAEHDELAQSILISDDQEFLNKVNRSIDNLIQDMPRKEIIKKSLFTERQIEIILKSKNLSDVEFTMTKGAYYRQVSQSRDKLSGLYYSFIVLGILGVVLPDDIDVISQLSERMSVIKDGDVFPEKEQEIISVIERVVKQTTAM